MARFFYGDAREQKYIGAFQTHIKDLTRCPELINLLESITSLLKNLLFHENRGWSMDWIWTSFNLRGGLSWKCVPIGSTLTESRDFVNADSEHYADLHKKLENQRACTLILLITLSRNIPHMEGIRAQWSGWLSYCKSPSLQKLIL